MFEDLQIKLKGNKTQFDWQMSDPSPIMLHTSGMSCKAPTVGLSKDSCLKEQDKILLKKSKRYFICLFMKFTETVSIRKCQQANLTLPTYPEVLQMPGQRPVSMSHVSPSLGSHTATQNHCKVPSSTV